MIFAILNFSDAYVHVIIGRPSVYLPCDRRISPVTDGVLSPLIKTQDEYIIHINLLS